MTIGLEVLIGHWKTDSLSTYNSWFLWDERLKNFRSIRRGLAQVVKDIDAGTFGSAFRGSSLETVVGSVAGQVLPDFREEGDPTEAAQAGVEVTSKAKKQGLPGRSVGP